MATNPFLASTVANVFYQLLQLFVYYHILLPWQLLPSPTHLHFHYLPSFSVPFISGCSHDRYEAIEEKVQTHFQGIISCCPPMAVEGKGASNEVEQVLQDLFGSGNRRNSVD